MDEFASAMIEEGLDAEHLAVRYANRTFPVEVVYSRRLKSNSHMSFNKEKGVFLLERPPYSESSNFEHAKLYLPWITQTLSSGSWHLPDDERRKKVKADAQAAGLPWVEPGDDDSYLVVEFRGERFRLDVVRSRRLKTGWRVARYPAEGRITLSIPEKDDALQAGRAGLEWLGSTLRMKPWCLPKDQRGAFMEEARRLLAESESEPNSEPKLEAPSGPDAHADSVAWVERGADESHFLFHLLGRTLRMNIVKSAEVGRKSRLSSDPKGDTYTLTVSPRSDPYLEAVTQCLELHKEFRKKNLPLSIILKMAEEHLLMLLAMSASGTDRQGKAEPGTGAAEEASAPAELDEEDEDAAEGDAEDWLGQLPGEHAIELRGRRIPYVIKPHAGRRRMSIFIVPGRGVEVRTPAWNTGREAAEKFLREQADWLLANLPLAHTAQLEFKDGAEIPYRGGKAVLRLGKFGNVVVPVTGGHELWLSVPKESSPEVVKAALAKLLKASAWRIINDCWMRVIPSAKKLPKGWQLSGARTRWGVCTSGDFIRLSWRLIALSDEEIEYVAAHELAHLIEFNHSPAFWQEVGKILPDWQERHQKMRARSANEKLDAL